MILHKRTQNRLKFSGIVNDAPAQGAAILAVLALVFWGSPKLAGLGILAFFAGMMAGIYLGWAVTGRDRHGAKCERLEQLSYLSNALGFLALYFGTGFARTLPGSFWIYGGLFLMFAFLATALKDVQERRTTAAA